MLAVIPVRGGSKRIPGKNIKSLGSKPLIQYTLDAASEVFKKDEIIVSTDSKEIKKVVNELGWDVPFLRPKELSTDSAGTYEVLLHAIDFVEKKGEKHNLLVLLQATSPFRNSQHIKEAIALYEPHLDMVISVKETSANPYYLLKEENEEGYLVPSKKSSLEKKDLPKVWELNGAIYVINIASLKKNPINKFKKVKKYRMDDLSSIDIDTPLDWIVAESVLKNNLFH